MKTTLGKIKSYKPCQNGWNLLIKNIGTDDLKKEVSILEILNNNGVRDAFWALRTQNYKDYCLILADIAESVLPIYLKKHPRDKTIQNCIKGIRDYKIGAISKDKLIKLAAAAYVAAADDDDAAASAAYVAAAAAADDAATAAYTAAYAVYDDVYVNICSLAKKNQWDKNEQILRKHLEKL